MKKIFLLLILIKLFQSKNILFPFKKLTIEYLNKTKSISDFVHYNIYTNIEMGTPKKSVAHFITRGNVLFYYNYLYLHSHSSKAYDEIQQKVENSTNLYYIPNDSSSFETINRDYQVYSDIYYLYDLNKDEKVKKLNFNMNSNDMKKKLYGNINLYFKGDPYDDYNKYIFKILKENDLIDDSYFSFIYGEYNIKSNSSYLNDNYDNILGNLIFGESPHEFAPNKYKKEDEIKLNGQFKFDVNEVYIKSKKSNYSEENIGITISFTSQFIRGSIAYKNETDKIFFNDLISKNICRIDYIEENIYSSTYIIYSCENSNKMKEKIKTFPSLYFVIKPYNLTFLFNYEELFQLHNNRLYFLVYYTVITSYSKWEVGELFLRKYITSFNYYSKTISFYKSQVDDINKKTDINVHDEKSDLVPDDDNQKNKMIIWIIVIIVCGVVLIGAIITIVLLVLKIKKFRKKRASELNDDNYDYTSANNIN